VKSGAEDTSSRTKPANRYSIRLTICVNRVWGHRSQFTVGRFRVTTTKDIVLVLVLEFGSAVCLLLKLSVPKALFKKPRGLHACRIPSPAPTTPAKPS
jgi:hypothetical protein